MGEIIAEEMIYIVLILLSGFLGALILRIADSIIRHYKKPKLEATNIKYTSSVDGSTLHLSIQVKNKGKSPALKCIGKIVITDENNNEEVYQVPWGVATNPDKYTIYPKDEVKLDLFKNKISVTDQFEIPIAVGERGSLIPGAHMYFNEMKKGRYKIKVKILGENTYLEHDMGELLLPDEIQKHRK